MAQAPNSAAKPASQAKHGEGAVLVTSRTISCDGGGGALAYRSLSAFAADLTSIGPSYRRRPYARSGTSVGGAPPTHRFSDVVGME